MKYKVIVDIGHLDCDVGAVNKEGIREVDLNVQIAKECARQLKRHNIEVISTTGTLANRVQVEHLEQPNYFVSIHNNAGGGTGAEILLYSAKYPQLELAQNIESELKTLTTSRGIKERPDLYVLSKTNCPACLVECSFIDSADIKRIDELHEQVSFGKAIARGILKTLKIDYIDEPKTNTLYRVCVGAFKDKNNAFKIQSEAKSKGFKDTYIMEVKDNG